MLWTWAYCSRLVLAQRRMLRYGQSQNEKFNTLLNHSQNREHIMAMSRPARPQLPIIGFVTAVTPRTKYDNVNRRYTDELVGYEVTVSQENGAQLLVRYGLDDLTPDAATRVAVVAEVNESREYGVTLAYLRVLSADDLDRMASFIAVPAGK